MLRQCNPSMQAFYAAEVIHYNQVHEPNNPFYTCLFVTWILSFFRLLFRLILSISVHYYFCSRRLVR